MLILNPIQDLEPIDIYTKKIKTDEKNSIIIRKPPDGRTDRRTDGRTNRVNPVYPPQLRCGGYNKSDVKRQNTLDCQDQY